MKDAPPPTPLTLVLLPGLDGTGLLMQPLLRHLPSEWNTVVVTYPLDEPLGYDELLPLVLARLPGTPFLLLGESFGGPLALQAAATRPAGLRGLILCATFVRNPAWFRPRWVRHLVQPGLFRLSPALAVGKTMLSGFSTPEIRRLQSEALSQVRPAVLSHRVREVLQVDVRRELTECPVPVLYLRGDRDLVVPRHNLTEIQSVRPSVEVARFHSPHLVLQTQPEAVAKALQAFAERCATDPDGQPPLTPPAGST
jgi:pimeloyl-[acyl-carrier protein] methyl ester esterase